MKANRLTSAWPSGTVPRSSRSEGQAHLEEPAGRARVQAFAVRRRIWMLVILLATLAASHALAGTSYTDWAVGYFGGAVCDSSQEATRWGPYADPDHDGRANLLEYALGNDPLSGADASAGIVVELKPKTDGGTERYLHANITQRKDDPLLECTPEVSADGYVWMSGPTGIEQVAVEYIDPAFDRGIWRDLTAVTPGHARLFRLQVRFISQAPLPPTGLTAQAASAGRIRLGWTDNSPNESGFEIQRRSGTSEWELIATVGADVTEFVDPAALVADRVYVYRARAANDGGASAWTTDASAQPFTDTDGDGLPDDWELANGLNPADADDATLDTDGDGTDNLTEYAQGRDPQKGVVPDSDNLVRLQIFTPLE